MLTLNATKRTNKQNDKLRAAGSIPAVVYAPDIEAESISISASEFEKLHREVGESTLIELNIEGESPRTVLIQDIQMAPVKDEVYHVDFYKITEGQELSASIALEFVGEAPGVKAGGTLMTQRDAIDVTCLPKDLVDNIEVDLSVLTEIGSSIHISDLNIPAGITVTDDAELLVATIVAPKGEEEEETEERSIDDIEVEEKGKADEDGEAEGSADAASVE